MYLNPNEAPIGIFDSGVGGLSVLREIHRQMPEESVIYFADQGHVPYGSRTLEEVRSFSIEITRFLLNQGVKLVVVACNTASAAALRQLRITFPTTPFVGMEPAVKPAAESTQTKVIGVLATPATFQGMLYAAVVERFGNGITILQNTCPGLVSQIEKGDLNSPMTREILEQALRPMLEQGIDTVVMGCTHFPFIIPIIKQIVGNEVQVIDPAPAVARQANRLLESLTLRRIGYKKGTLRFITSGDLARFKSLLPVILGETGLIQKSEWIGNQIIIQEMLS